LLDARPREEYEAGHLPGAVSTPVEALRTGKVPLKPSKRYVVYCRGPYCVFADEAVTLLRERGFDATRLALGPAEWLAAGGAVERVS
jgi:rhodanese-related sulfurtransferase